MYTLIKYDIGTYNKYFNKNFIKLYIIRVCVIIIFSILHYEIAYNSMCVQYYTGICKETLSIINLITHYIYIFFLQQRKILQVVQYRTSVLNWLTPYSWPPPPSSSPPRGVYNTRFMRHMYNTRNTRKF